MLCHDRIAFGFGAFGPFGTFDSETFSVDALEASKVLKF